MKDIINMDTGEMIPVIKEKEDGTLVIAKEACDIITAYERICELLNITDSTVRNYRHRLRNPE